MLKTPLIEDEMLSKLSSEIWTLLTKAGHLTKWLLFYCESMDMESSTKELLPLSNSLRNTKNSIRKVLVGIDKSLKRSLNGEEGEERERERRA